jgi:hypothetical protein
VDWHTAQSQPIIGTPVEVPVPRNVIRSPVRAMCFHFTRCGPESSGMVLAGGIGSESPRVGTGLNARPACFAVFSPALDQAPFYFPEDGGPALGD